MGKLYVIKKVVKRLDETSDRTDLQLDTIPLGVATTKESALSMIGEATKAFKEFLDGLEVSYTVTTEYDGWKQIVREPSETNPGVFWQHIIGCEEFVPDVFNEELLE